MILQQPPFLLYSLLQDSKYMLRFVFDSVRAFSLVASVIFIDGTASPLFILQIVMELPVEHGLLLDNLLDLAHAPFTHTSTFAKGWSVPRFIVLGSLVFGFYILVHIIRLKSNYLSTF